jgi:phosphate transport system substrate-binding protein
MAIMLTMVRAAKAALVTVGVGSAAAFATADVRLQGAGATFPEPLYQKWVTEYQKSHPDVKIDYQGIGSGGGIKGITEKTVQFAGSDAPLNKKELEALGGPEKVVQIPTCAGAVVPAYNVPGVNADLKFTGEVLADIFSGKISMWNDKRLADLNPGIKLPDTAITPAWRTDGSGTNYVFTNYLATQSESFKENVGVGKQVKWPVGQGGKGNPGVAAVVQQTPGAIGYIELNYALQNKIAFGLVKNKSGKFVKASPETTSYAGEGAVASLKGTVLAADIWNQPGDQAYPIASFTYMIVYRDLNNLASEGDAQALVNFLHWVATDAQKDAGSLDYAPLSKGVQGAATNALNMLTYKGKKLTATKH